MRHPKPLPAEPNQGPQHVLLAEILPSGEQSPRRTQALLTSSKNAHTATQAEDAESRRSQHRNSNFCSTPSSVTSSSPEQGTRGQVVQLPRSSHWGSSGLTMEVGTDPRGAYFLLLPQNRASDRAPSPADGCVGRVLQGNVLSVLLCLSQCGKC